MIPNGGFVSLMMPEILQALRVPDDPGRAASPAAREAYLRAMFVAKVTTEELSSAYADAEPLFDARLAREYALMLGLPDLQEAERFYSSPAGGRFAVATLALRGSAAYRYAMEAIAPRISTAQQRIARRIAASPRSSPSRTAAAATSSARSAR